MRAPDPHDSCSGAADAAFTLLQEKWVLPILWTLSRDAMGFNELLRALGGAGPTTLAQRLDRLEAAGVVSREVQSVSPPRTSYALTAAGRDLQSVFDGLRAWCETHHGAPDHAACATDGPPSQEPPFVQVMTALQEKWSMPVMRQLAGGPRGFNELGRLVGGVNAGTLGQRLERLESLGMIEKTVLSTFPPKNSYALTPAGRDFGTVLGAIAAWGARHLAGTTQPS